MLNAMPYANGAGEDLDSRFENVELPIMRLNRTRQQNPKFGPLFQ